MPDHSDRSHPAANPRVLALLFAGSLAAPCGAQQVFINELHYDNAGADTGEFVEIAGPAGTNLAGYSLVLYNGSGGAAYITIALSGTIDDENASGFGAVSFGATGIQNGSPDGLALVRGATLLQFLSYEGSFTAAGGTAEGAASIDIGVAETASTPVGESLQLGGTGNVYGDFAWGGPSTASPGTLNAGQILTGGNGMPSIGLSIAPSILTEGGASGTATLTLSPPPASPVTVSLFSSAPMEAAVPLSVAVPINGTATFAVTPMDDGVPDGPRNVTLTASDSTGFYTPGSAQVTVLDADRAAVRGMAMRVAAINTLNGVGPSGSAGFLALRAVLARVDADVIAFSEVSEAGDFADLKDLVAALGFGTTPQFLATRGDAFAGAAYVSGDFSSGQSIALASRWPILETAQIGRGVAGRKEMTRFPLFVRIDVPGVGHDPAVVAVHLKAGGNSSDLFRKAVEAHRIQEFLLARGLDGANDNLFIVGDVNEDWDNFQPTSMNTGINLASPGFSDGSTFPGSYQLGSDLTGANAIALETRDFPVPSFQAVGIGVVDTRQADVLATRTYLPFGDARLDYILPGIRARTNGNGPTEIYNSVLDGAFDGLPKVGFPLPGGTSSLASDHLAIFGDFELEPVPALALSFSEQALNDRAGPFSLTGTLSANPPPAPGKTVALHFHLDRPSCVSFPPSVTLTGPDSQVTFPVHFSPDGGVVPDRLVTVSAFAEGHSTGHGRLLLTNSDVSGFLLVSQYIETPSGSSPKAIELLNRTGSTIDFAATPLSLYTYANGSATRERLLLLERGLLPVGQVLVVGDVTTGNFLIGQGLLSDPSGELATAEHGSLIPSDSTQAVFVKRSFTFNGDDALEVHLGFTRADVFGQPGHSPGTSWNGGGVSTANQNLTLRPDAATGSEGFTDPSRRFLNAAPGSDLTGFGVPPVLADPYLDWADSRGLVGLAAAPSGDPDKDGYANVLEYALGGDPLDGGSIPRIEALRVVEGAHTYGAVRFRRPVAPGRVILGVESANGLVGWQTNAVLGGAPVANGDGSETVVFRAPLPLSQVPALSFRISGILP